MTTRIRNMAVKIAVSNQFLIVKLIAMQDDGQLKHDHAVNSKQTRLDLEIDLRSFLALVVCAYMLIANHV